MGYARKRGESIVSAKVEIQGDNVQAMDKTEAEETFNIRRS